VTSRLQQAGSGKTGCRKRMGTPESMTAMQA